jgi:hypothetical protein
MIKLYLVIAEALGLKPKLAIGSMGLVCISGRKEAIRALSAPYISMAALALERGLQRESETTKTAARTLQREGVPDDTPISMTHEDSAIVSMRFTVVKQHVRLWSRLARKTEAQTLPLMPPQMAIQRVRGEAKTAMSEAEVGMGMSLSSSACGVFHPIDPSA